MSRSRNLRPFDYLLVWELICRGVGDDFSLCDEYRKLTGESISVESIKKIRKFLNFFICEINKFPHLKLLLAQYLCKIRLLIDSSSE